MVKIIFRINWVLTTILSMATGVFKLLQQNADVALFKTIGFNSSMVIVLGIIQLIGGLLLIPSKTRKIGAFIMIPTFIIASIAVFANNMVAFGVVSILFILMAIGVIIMENKFPSTT